MKHNDVERIMRQYCSEHRIRLFYPDSNPGRNEGGQAGRTIWLGEFDDADCLIAAFFHEVGHIIDGRRKFCQNHRITIFERELRAWTCGLEKMHNLGIGTDAKAIGYMMDRLSRYAAKEAGSGSPDPDVCPTCNHSPIVKIIRDGDGYVGHIECSPETRAIRGLLDSGTHIHFDASGPCATPEEAYDAAVETWNGHLAGTLERGREVPTRKRRRPCLARNSSLARSAANTKRLEAQKVRTTGYLFERRAAQTLMGRATGRTTTSSV